MDLTVMTKSGPVTGFAQNQCIKFLGIPFAKPPVGPLRFRRAQPVTPWTQPLMAQAYGAAAIQYDHEMYMGSEDCLTLNIVGPENQNCRSEIEGYPAETVDRPAKDNDLLPVFVWIHGGGYNTGSASDELYNGECFARSGILFVSIQYRLNVLGFYDFCTYPGCEDMESNRGLSDQIMALQWIHDNISAFGGDPSRVTIGGESAGGAAVTTLMAVPSVRGLFSQVIAQSSLPNCVMTLEMARENMDLFMEGMGWNVEDLQKLRTDDPFTFLKGNAYVAQMHQMKNPGMFLPGPVIDDLLPERPIDAIAAGSGAGVRLLIGANLHEGTMFVHPENTGFPNSWEMIREMFLKNGHGDCYPAIKEFYSDNGLQPPLGTPFIHFATDYAFWMPSIKVAQAQRAFGDVWMYRFEYLSMSGRESGMLVSHAFELPFVFQNKTHPFAAMELQGEPEDEVDALMAHMFNAWAGYIRNGDPGADWPQFTGHNAPVRIFDRKCRTELLNMEPLMTAWKDMRFYEN